MDHLRRRPRPRGRAAKAATGCHEGKDAPAARGKLPRRADGAASPVAAKPTAAPAATRPAETRADGAKTDKTIYKGTKGKLITEFPE